ncbi:hypothetical protein KQX54_005710 [Cotesia glomerata]|uniref:Uncharacterized protein n=1 Tax=Cotesia glomerata TaxID=32391 RepID=A0AAV7IFX5_COTGL|nr:hypothetical protein KQX54_005710 [Cotesia glomerata]
MDGEQQSSLYNDADRLAVDGRLSMSANESQSQAIIQTKALTLTHLIFRLWTFFVFNWLYSHLSTATVAAALTPACCRLCTCEIALWALTVSVQTSIENCGGKTEETKKSRVTSTAPRDLRLRSYTRTTTTVGDSFSFSAQPGPSLLLPDANSIL